MPPCARPQPRSIALTGRPPPWPTASSSSASYAARTAGGTVPGTPTALPRRATWPWRPTTPASWTASPGWPSSPARRAGSTLPAPLPTPADHFWDTARLACSPRPTTANGWWPGRRNYWTTRPVGQQRRRWRCGWRHSPASAATPARPIRSCCCWLGSCRGRSPRSARRWPQSPACRRHHRGRHRRPTGSAGRGVAAGCRTPWSPGAAVRQPVVEGRPEGMAFVCQDHACQLPASTVEICHHPQLG